MSINSGGLTNTSSEGVSRVVLDINMDIAGASKLHAELKKCVARGVDVNLDAAKVETIDTTVLQLLLALVREVRDNGNSVSWQSPSEAVMKTAKLTGLEKELGLAKTSI